MMGRGAALFLALVGVLGCSSGTPAPGALGAACRPGAAADGSVRCLPVDTLSYDDDPARDAYFTDPECKIRVLVKQNVIAGCFDDRPRFGQRYESAPTADGCSIESRQRFFKLGPRSKATQIFRRQGAGAACTMVRASTIEAYFPLGPELSPDELAAFTAGE